MYPSNAILKVNFKQKRSFVTQEENGECCQNSLRNWKGKTTSICRHCSSVSCLKKRAILQLFLPSLNPIPTAAHFQSRRQCENTVTDPRHISTSYLGWLCHFHSGALFEVLPFDSYNLQGRDKWSPGRWTHLTQKDLIQPKLVYMVIIFISTPFLDEREEKIKKIRWL